jgi:hypothetical protein
LIHRLPKEEKIKKPIKKKGTKGTPGKRKSMPRNALLWQYFKPEENSQEVNPRAVCKACETFVKRADGSTSLMKGHLEKYHPDLNKEHLMMVTKANLEKVKLMQYRSIFVRHSQCVPFTYCSLHHKTVKLPFIFIENIVLLLLFLFNVHRSLHFKLIKPEA